MAKSKVRKAREAAGAAGKTAAEARRTTTAQVENPYGNGGVDRVTVVSDTVAWLAARGMIDARQQAAAATYRRAYDVAHADLACLLGKDTIDGRRGDGVTASRLDAGRVLREADAVLGPVSRVVRSVIGEGRTVEEAAAEIHGSSGRAQRTAVSYMLRLGLEALADAWERPVRRVGIVSSHSDDYRPMADADGDRALDHLMRVAHCTLRRVYLA
ncbi:hypothetical protein DLJ53_21925 [Acuticoccus sediminis]|uniref:Uncharacterized protein n=1 Tax=Acuticoccus sediminis TaxID=2184697 RepID=A0A8B2NU84_9HYPH|nr:hypothetical protein [Acuticoccus sediminis]RAH99206.1 hypothetical protein DLJ53_21925 [Acuticoccus sediminis]